MVNLWLILNIKYQKEIEKNKNMAFTLKQKATLRKHSSHHSAKHMKAMKLAMNKGTSFTKAHKSALKKVGA